VLLLKRTDWFLYSKRLIIRTGDSFIKLWPVKPFFVNLLLSQEATAAMDK
jgi:hypothetical protein